MGQVCRNFVGAVSLLPLLLGCQQAQAALSGPTGTVRHVSLAPLPGISSDHQFRTIEEAASQVQPGDTVLVHTGTYRESVTINRSGTGLHPIRFEAAPGANVVVTGTDLLTNLRKEPGTDNVFSTHWPTSFLDDQPNHAYPNDDRLIGRCEQVFVQNYLLHQVLRRDQLSRGTFFADLSAKRLYLWEAGNRDLAGSEIPVAASTRSVLWTCRGDNVLVHGIRFRGAANAAQSGAAQFVGRGDVIEDCVFEDTNGVGASFSAPAQIVRRCTFRDNGQMGFGAVRADNLLVTGCLIQNNNSKGFDRGWEAGGSKTVLTRRAVIDHCRVLDNRGVGLWFDIGNEGCVVQNCLIAGNEDAGVFYEISYGLHAHDNVIFGNGFGETPGAWGGQAGLSLSSSAGCFVERNLLIGNREGFAFREQERTTARIGSPPGSPEVPVWNHDEVIRHNLLADNRDAQVWGWFDVDDEREWPRAMQQNPHAAADLPLEKLHLTFSSNLYDVPDGQSLLNWGTDWRRHIYYTELSSVRKDLKLEQGSVKTPVPMADPAAFDFRVPRSSPALKNECYPQGDIPGVLLGVAGR